jgi:hypothetical protein
MNPGGVIVWSRLRKAWIEGLITKHSETGVLNAGGLRKELGRYGSTALDILLPVKERRALDAVLNVTDAMRAGNRIAGGALVAKSAQAGGGVMIYQGVRRGEFFKITAGGVLMFGPITYAKMATHPVGSKILRFGLGRFKGDRELAAAAIRIGRFLQTQARKEAKDDAKLQRRYEQASRPSRPIRPVELPGRPVGGHHF